MQSYEDRERAVLVAAERMEGHELLDESNGQYIPGVWIESSGDR